MNNNRQPNIIIFNPDEFRADALSHLGNPAAHTPYLDRLVNEDAISISNCFSQNPVCTPSRCSFMTGWYPHVRGHRTMFHMLRKDEPMFLKVLKDNGWYVWWGGKNDVVPAQLGFEDYCNEKYDLRNHKRKINFGLHADQSWRGEPGSDNYYSFYAGKLPADSEDDRYYDADWAFVEAAIDFIKNRPKNKPFVIYLPLLYPHPPYGVEDPWFSLIDRKKLPARIKTPKDWSYKPSILKGIYEGQGLQNWPEAKWNELRATYLGMCARVDYQFGLIVETLKKEKIYDETLIFFFSDHGDFVGDYGLVEKTQNTFEDCLTKVPFIIKPPNWIHSKNGIRNALIELVDFPATVFDVCNITPGYDHFGKSLLPIIEDDSINTFREFVFSEGGRRHGEKQCMELESGVKEGDLYWPRARLQRQEGPEHTKAAMIRTEKYKYVKRLYERDEFYDLDKDPQELTNEINNIEYADIISKLKEKMLNFFIETSDVVHYDTDKREVF